jgi:hypothetical protein
VKGKSERREWFGGVGSQVSVVRAEVKGKGVGGSVVLSSKFKVHGSEFDNLEP